MRPRALMYAAVLAMAAPAHAQTGSVRGVIVSRQTGEPLAYGIVGLPALGREMFANDSGVFVFRDLPAGPAVLRVRRLGYAPAETTLYVRPDGADTVRMALPRVAVQLGGLTVRAYPPCIVPGIARIQSDSTLASIVTQLRLNAEQYRLLAASYPFFYAMETTYSSRQKADGEVKVDGKQFLRVDSKTRWTYKPGEILFKRGRDWFFHIPVLPDFAETAFLDNHCFHNGGTEVVNERELLRIDVVAAERIAGPDVNGSIYFDPASFQVVRTFLRLSRSPKVMRDILDFEITTDFKEILPSIPVIAHVWSVQAIDPNAKRKYDTAYELQHLVAFRWLGAKPGEEGAKKTP